MISKCIRKQNYSEQNIEKVIILRLHAVANAVIYKQVRVFKRFQGLEQRPLESIVVAKVHNIKTTIMRDINVPCVLSAVRNNNVRGNLFLFSLSNRNNSSL